MINYDTLKTLFFKIDPEVMHKLGEVALSCGVKVPGLLNPFIEKNFVIHDSLKQNIFGRDFLNPVGLGAGYDKDAKMIRGLLALGFGFTEVGTVTPKPQSGNEKPRLWRHIEEEALQNAMGFNNGGAHAMSRHLKKTYPFVTPIGVNLGKNKKTEQSRALDDYENLIKEFRDLSDYMVINISSPNTPNLRDLQNIEFIKALFTKAKSLTEKPILLKIAPDMSVENALELCSEAVDSGAAGIIATNTTIDYSLVKNPLDRGGISGKPLKEKSRAIFKEISREFFGKTTLISVGGIDSKEEALERLKLGANLIQIYTSLIYNGPTFVREINEYLIEEIKKEGLEHISELIGISHK